MAEGVKRSEITRWLLSWRW